MSRFLVLALAALALVASAPARAAAPGDGVGPGHAGSSGTAFVLPLPPPPHLLRPFEPPAHRYGPGHRGVDLAAALGAPVRAAGAGRVVFAAPLAGRGVVSIEHVGGLRTTYEPVTAGVVAGRWVAAGDAIGVLQAGHAGCAPADCLHWGARLPGDVYLDPMTLLTGWPVRLLPWDDS